MASCRCNHAFHALAVTLSLLAPSWAADPLLEQLEPQGGQRGTVVKIVLRGQRLEDGPHQFLWHDTGIEATALEVIDGKQAKCEFRLADDCRLGRHALRLRTASGLSNLVTFHVGNLPEIDEAEPNDTKHKPQEIATDVVVNGVIKEHDVDVFAMEVEKGERLSVEIEGIRLGRTLFDPLLELRDESGTLLAVSDDQAATQQDAFVSTRATKTGRMFIHLREVAFRGSNQATYRLHVGRFPRPKAVFPPVAIPGKPVEVRWIGGGDGEQTATIEVPKSDSNTCEIHAIDEQGISPSGIPLYLSALPQSREAEPNNRRQDSNELPVPGIACGVISEPQDKDFYRFTLKKGQTIDLRVRARLLRSSLDSVLHLYNADGKYLKGNDDDAGKPDSYLRFKAPVDGDYFLHVVDRLFRGRDDMVYAIEISEPTPIVELQLDERRRYNAQVINVPQGGRTAAMMTVRRRDVGGPMQVEWSGVPEGCEVSVMPLAANYNRVPVLFTAEPQAELSASLATVTARLAEKPRPITSLFRQQTWLVRGRNQVAVWSHFTERTPVAVTNALPYSIQIVEPKAPLVQGGSMQLKIVAQREEGFENSIAVRTIYNTPGMSTNQSLSIKKGETEVLVPITANAKARTGEWKIAFLGKTNIRGAVETSSQLATLKIVEPFFEVTIPTLTVVQGETKEVTVTFKQRHPFPGDAELQLVRLPPGVTAQKVLVNSESQSVVFQLTVAADARAGRHRGVGCEVLLTVEDEPVQFRQGYAELRVDPAPAAKTAKRRPSAGEESS